MNASKLNLLLLSLAVGWLAGWSAKLCFLTRGISFDRTAYLILSAQRWRKCREGKRSKKSWQVNMNTQIHWRLTFSSATMFSEKKKSHRGFKRRHISSMTVFGEIYKTARVGLSRFLFLLDFIDGNKSALLHSTIWNHKNKLASNLIPVTTTY